MDDSRPTIVDFLTYIRSLDPSRYKQADFLEFNDDAALWLERSIAHGVDIGKRCADFPMYLAAKCSLRDLQLGNDLDPDLDGRVFILGPLLARCALRKNAVAVLSWGVVYEGESFEFVDGTKQALRHVPAKHDDKTNIIAAWAVGRAPDQPYNAASVEFLDTSSDREMKITEKAIRGLLESITASLPVARALRLNVEYLAGADQSHEYLFPAFPTFDDVLCPACVNGQEMST